MFIKTLTLLLTSLLLCGPLYAQVLSGGETLKTAIGARQAGMGEMFTALSGDIHCLYYNPAGLAGLATPVITSSYTSNIFENQEALVAGGLPVSWAGPGALAFSLVNALGAKMEINHLDGTSENLISQNDFLATLGYAQQFLPNFHAGANIKVLSSTLVEQYTATAVGVDLGILMRDAVLPGVNIGAALQHVGSKIQYDEEGDAMPTTLRIGIAYQRVFQQEHGLRAGVDFLFPNDSDSLQHIGVEYAWQNTLFLRAGYKLGYDLDTFTVGGGANYQGIQFDYAFSGFTAGGNAHRIGLGYAFSQGSPEAEISTSP